MSDDEPSAFTPEELLDGIFGRLIQANDATQKTFVTDLRKLILKIRDRREHREDARLILHAYGSGRMSDDDALDRLGFGEPIDPFGPRAK